jgi:hypothetical protein
MFCESCGAALKDGAKFCGSCGAKVESSATAASSSVVNSIKLAALPAGLANCEINIKSVTAEGPDSDGDLSISITYEVTNKSDEDWEYLSVRTQLLNAAGQIVEDTQDTHEQSFDAGETEELQASFYRVKAKFLGENPEKAHVVIYAVASTLIQQKLGQVDIPANAFEVTALKPTKLGESVQLISGSLWKTEPDDDKDSRVEVKALIQNLTDKNLPLVKITAEINDKKGNEVADAGGSDEVRPGSIVTVSGSGYTKDKKLIGAKAELAVLVYTPVAAGVSQHCGIHITSEPQTDGESDFVRCEWPSFVSTENNTEEEADNCVKNGQKLLDALEEETGLNDGWESAVEWDSVEYDEDESILVRDVHLTAKGFKDIWKIVVNINFNSRSGSSFDDENLEIAALYVYFKWKDRDDEWRDDDSSEAEEENILRDKALKSFRDWVTKTFSTELSSIDSA